MNCQCRRHAYFGKVIMMRGGCSSSLFMAPNSVYNRELCFYMAHDTHGPKKYASENCKNQNCNTDSLSPSSFSTVSFSVCVCVTQIEGDTKNCQTFQ